MKTRIASVALAAVVACGWASGAEAAYIVKIDEVGGNVVVTGSGSLDLSGLSRTSSTGFLGPIFTPFNSIVAIGDSPNQSNYDWYSGVVGPASFGQYRQSLPPVSSTDGPSLFLELPLGGLFGVRDGFTGGNYGPTTATIDDTFLYGLGLLPNQTFTYRLGSAASADTVTFITGSTVGPVPLPASAPLFGVALVALAGISWTARRRAA